MEDGKAGSPGSPCQQGAAQSIMSSSRRLSAQLRRLDRITTRERHILKKSTLRTPTGAFRRREGGKLIKFTLAWTTNLRLTRRMVISYVHSSLPWKSNPLLRLSKTRKISHDKSFPEELI